MSEKAAILFTGGKDSTLALFKAKQAGYSVNYLISLLPYSKDSYLFHKPSLRLLKAQASSLGLPLIILRSKKATEKADLEKALRRVRKKVSTIVVGGLASSYQASRFRKAASKLGMTVYAPLWRLSGRDLWQTLLKEHFSVIFTKIACAGLSKDWLNREITRKRLTELESLSKRYGFDLALEGGDAETAVLDCPLFKKKLSVTGKTVSESTYRHFFVIERVRKVKKGNEIKERQRNGSLESEVT